MTPKNKIISLISVAILGLVIGIITFGLVQEYQLHTKFSNLPEHRVYNWYEKWDYSNNKSEYNTNHINGRWMTDEACELVQKDMDISNSSTKIVNHCDSVDATGGDFSGNQVRQAIVQDQNRILTRDTIFSHILKFFGLEK
jgi:hypothetical protein